MEQYMQKNKERKRLLATFVLGLLACAVLFYAYGFWPFGDLSVITGDLNGQYVSYYAYFKKALGTSGFYYSFEKGLGGNMLGLFAYYCASPLNLLYLCVPVSAYAAVANVVLALKLALTGTTFAFFAGRHYEGLNNWGILAGLCYAFCGYNIVYAQNIMWLDVVILLPLICYGIDKLIETGKPFVFCCALALAIFTNFYIAYMVCIFAVLYFLANLLLAKEVYLPAKKAEETKQKWNKSFICSRCVSFAVFALLAAGLTAFMLLPSLADIATSKGIGGGFRFTLQFTFPLKELAQQLWPAGFTWQSVQNGLPNIYCGLFVVVMAIGFFVSKTIAKKEKALYGFIVGFITLSFLVSGLNIVWHGFAEPIWFPYRYSFLFSFMLVFLACGFLAQQTYTKKEVLWASGIFAVFCGWSFLIRYESLTLTKMAVAGIVLCIALICLWVAKRGGKANLQKIASVACALLVCAEVVFNAGYVLNSFEKYTVSGFRVFVQDGTETVQQIKQQDSGNYRVEKIFFRSYNDPLLLNYNGISHFGSTQDVSSSALLDALGLGGYMPFAGGTLPTADSLLGVKYLFATAEDVPPQHYIKTTIQAPYIVYENPYAFPLAYMVDDTGEINLTGENIFTKQNNIYSGLYGTSDVLYTLQNITTTNESGEIIPHTGKTAGGQVQYTFTAGESGPYYLSIQIADPYSIIVACEGKTFQFYGVAFSGALCLGEFAQGEDITITAILPETTVGTVEVAFFNQPLFEKTAMVANENAVNLNWEDGYVHGTVMAEKDTTLLLSIPYDTNWTCTINGEKVEVQNVAGYFAGIQLMAGENIIELKYKPPYVWLGIFISTTCLILVIILYRKSKNQNAKTEKKTENKNKTKSKSKQKR